MIVVSSFKQSLLALIQRLQDKQLSSNILQNLPKFLQALKKVRQTSRNHEINEDLCTSTVSFRQNSSNCKEKNEAFLHQTMLSSQCCDGNGAWEHQMQLRKLIFQVCEGLLIKIKQILDKYSSFSSKQLESDKLSMATSDPLVHQVELQLQNLKDFIVHCLNVHEDHGLEKISDMSVSSQISKSRLSRSHFSKKSLLSENVRCFLEHKNERETNEISTCYGMGKVVIKAHWELKKIQNDKDHEIMPIVAKPDNQKFRLASSKKGSMVLVKFKIRGQSREERFIKCQMDAKGSHLPQRKAKKEELMCENCQIY